MKIVFTKVPFNNSITKDKEYALNDESTFKDDFGSDRISPLPWNKKRGTWIESDWEWRFTGFEMYLKEIER